MFVAARRSSRQLRLRLATQSLSRKPNRFTLMSLLAAKARADPKTGIFIPENYRIPSKVDLLLYLHGHHEAKPKLSIDGYWLAAQNPQWALREAVNTSGKNVILVAPTLGPKSQAGKLTEADGLDWYLDQVMAALINYYDPIKKLEHRPQLGNIIIACHSGGGWPMRQIAGKAQRYSNQIRECWGFDCLYNRGDDTFWRAWAKSRPDAKLYVYYLDSTLPNSVSLGRIVMAENL